MAFVAVDKIDEEEKAKTVIAQTTFEYSKQTTKRIRKLKSRLALYLILFGEIK